MALGARGGRPSIAETNLHAAIALDRFRNGEPVAVIAADLGISVHALYLRANRQGISRPPPKQLTQAEVEALLEENAALREEVRRLRARAGGGR